MMPEVFSKLSPIYAYPELLKLLKYNVTIIAIETICSIIKHKLIVRKIVFPKV